MSQTIGLVLVTGATGFVGSHIVSQILAGRIRIRAVVRSTSKLKAIFPHAGSQLEVVELPSLLDDYSEALRGVSAVIHTAVPAYFNGASNEETFKGAYDGTLNIVKQAISLGIKKIIVTGTAASLFDVDLKGAFGTRLITERDFGPIELPDIRPNEQDPRLLYRAAKTVADKKLWEIAADYPDVDITLLLPTLVFGPFVPRYPYPSDINHLGTNSFIYALIKGTPGNQNPYPSYPGGYVVDVRDVAKAHVLALAAPPIPGRYKRMIISAGTFTWEDAVEVVRKKHPELVPRLPSASAVPPAQTSAPLDTSFASEVLGLKEYIPWQESIAEAIEVCLEYENKLKA